MTIETEIRLADELATLKREHEQLRAAALRFYVDQGEPITDASIELVEALDAPSAEPVRETFDAGAVRTLLRCVFNSSHASSQTILAAEAVRDSERK